MLNHFLRWDGGKFLHNLDLIIMSWKASSYSSIGVQHQKLQTPCQDYADYYFVKNEIIIG